MKIEDLETPCFIVKEEELINNIVNFKSSLNQFFRHNILSYSIKTNSLPFILDVAKKNNCFAEVVSYDEYNLAKIIGFKPEKIIYNGPMKNKETFVEALTNGAYVNIETKREINWLEDISVKDDMHLGIRINIDLNNLINNIKGKNDSRFGFSYENGELKSAINKIRSYGFKKIGIHAHRTSKTRELYVYESIIHYVSDIIKNMGIELSFFDLGGGYYGNMPNKPTYFDYVETFSKSFKDTGINMKDITFIVEPGNALIASPIDFLSTIIDKKLICDQLICVSDGSRNDIDPLFHKTDYFKHIIKKNTTERISSQLITGCTCLENDRLFELHNEEEINIGDKILYECVGAYTQTLSPNFIRLIPNVYALKDNEYILVRKKWTEKEWIQNCKLEENYV